MYLALLTAILGGLHCVGMCGPLLISLPFKNWSGIFTYHTGRVLVYAIWGGFLGLFGEMAYIGGFQQSLSITLGIFIVFSVLLPKSFHFLNQSLWSKQLIKYRQLVLPHLKKNIYLHWLALGIFNGLLPCGLVYVASIGATVMGTFWEGSLYMALFGLGTIPVTILFSTHKNWMNSKTKVKILNIIPILLLITGTLLILRGLNLEIPYLSPTVEKGAVRCVKCE